MKRRAFTLVEMLVVIAIIAVLLGLTVGVYNKFIKKAEKEPAQELVKNAATALTQLYGKMDHVWPNRLLTGNGRLDDKQALVLAKRDCMPLTMNGEKTALAGVDKFGIVTPWAAEAIKKAGTSASESTPVRGSGSTTVQDHVLYYAIDVDGNGVIEGDELSNLEGVQCIHATAAVWCIGKSGGNHGKPWPFKEGLRRGDVYSFTEADTRVVK